ncbi:MAG: phage tail protein, partial [Pseudomonadota bacterium]
GTSYTYQTAVALGLCEGAIWGIGNVYVNKSRTSLAALGFSLFNGNYGQAPWGYLSAKYIDQALGYSGVAYVTASSYQLGNNPQLPNHNFEIYGVFSNSLSGIGVIDADPSLVVSDLLTNSNYGAGLPVARLGDLSIYRAYCIASVLWISPAYTSQSQASSILDDIATATNSEFVWSSGVLNIVPYGDTNITANGYTYTAPSAPLYDLGDDDFIANGNNDPIFLMRKRPSDTINSVKIECLDRNNSYNPAIIEAKDQALIEKFGLRQSSSSQMHLFADLNAAKVSAHLKLQRNASRNIYHFTLDQRYVLLDPMDIVTISDANLGLNKQWVRILEISENNNGDLDIIAEEYLLGSGHAPLYDYESGQGYAVNYDASGGNVNPPIIFEPTAELAESLQVWIAASGGKLWGGCDVYISIDGDSYKNIGTIKGSARTGSLSAEIAAVNANVSGKTIDQANVLKVDLSQSNGQLLSVSQSDVLSLATLCYVDGEYIAYQNATLTGSNKYNLSWLVRGGYGTLPVRHSLGSRFARIDDSIFKFDFPAEYIGKTVYIKLLSFNIYGGGKQNLADVSAYSYNIKGTGFSSPLPTPQNLRTVYVAQMMQLMWDNIGDFRPVLYEIRKGANWSGGQYLGRVSNPPFSIQGNDTYWLAAYSQPVAGLQVYSAPVEIIVTGSSIVGNVIATYDEASSGWSGTLGGSAAIVGSNIITGGVGDILSDADYLGTLDILFYGFVGNASYEIGSTHNIDIGRVDLCNLAIAWQSFAQHIYADILTVGDLLNFSDVLDYAATSNVDIYPEIALSQDGVTWGAWQKYSAGSYLARKFKARMQLHTYDPTVAAILSGFVFSVDAPDRDDHYINQAIASGGTTITFKPDASGTAAAFNGGNGGASLPSVQVTILNASAGDDAVISSLSLSSCVVRVLNGGVGVARNVNLLVQGY